MTLILAIIIIFIAVLGLGVSVFFSKNRAFPETHVGHNKEMQKCGLTCARCEDMGGCSISLKSTEDVVQEY
ncbi:MAG: hypothetical protein A2046_12215 [Bacteroidetes bacterium GWA2_30_7]|nr:MAG: hypothetical protein A2046_12215 [Bacteroidetes bacterium GWA2_30_7]